MFGTKTRFCMFNKKKNLSVIDLKFQSLIKCKTYSRLQLVAGVSSKTFLDLSQYFDQSHQKKMKNFSKKIDFEFDTSKYSKKFIHYNGLFRFFDFSKNHMYILKKDKNLNILPRLGHIYPTCKIDLELL